MVLCLSPLAGCRVPSAPPADWGVRFADYVLTRWPDPWDIHDGGWEYNAGIVLYGLWRTYEVTQDTRYRDYVQRWVDHFVDSGGDVAVAAVPNLDLIQPGVLLLGLYGETRDERYRLAAERISVRLVAHPRNAEGGWWHKGIYPNEMWLDSIYMAGVFCARYGRLFGPNGACPDDAVEQALVLARHAQDSRTGLLRHAWDADGDAAWAETGTGLAPVIWCRGLGWYAMALTEMLADLPPDHDRRDDLLRVLRSLARGIVDVQDRESGLWFQVANQGARADNWIETSGSAMLVYALQTGAERGYLGPRYARAAARGWKGLCARLGLDAQGAPQIAHTAEGMGVQPSYETYVNKGRLTNSTHGLAAVMLAAAAMEH